MSVVGLLQQRLTSYLARRTGSEQHRKRLGNLLADIRGRVAGNACNIIGGIDRLQSSEGGKRGCKRLWVRAFMKPSRQ